MVIPFFILLLPVNLIIGIITFFDVGAFVWFAHIIEWEFPGFSVERCFAQLLEMQREIEARGRIEGTTHRYLIVARK